jgi:hypothetical protein
MLNRRQCARRKSRFLIEWHRGTSLCTGFTHDVSATGIFVRSTYIPKIGTALTMKLLVPGSEKLQLRGIVVRSYRVPASLRRFVPSGFCVRLNEAPEEYFKLLATLFGLHFSGEAKVAS